ncbi:hypothetical protein E2320_022285, partial [Naja naja]
MAGLSLLLLLLFWLLTPTSAERMQAGCVLPNTLQTKREVYRPGDFIIGGNFPIGNVHAFAIQSYKKKPSLLQESIGFEFTKGDRRDYPSFFRISPKESAQCVGFVQLLLYFQWNWVGLVAPENDNGERFISSLVPMLKEKEICLAFTEILKSDFLHTTILKLLHILETWAKTEVIILFGDPNSITNVQAAMSIHEHLRKTSFWKVWVLTSHWKPSVLRNQDILKVIKPFHGALHFRHHTGDVSEFSHFLLSLDPLKPQEDVFLPL